MSYTGGDGEDCLRLVGTDASDTVTVDSARVFLTGQPGITCGGLESWAFDLRDGPDTLILSGGTMQIAHDDAISAGTGLRILGGTFDLGPYSNTLDNVFLASGSITGSGTLIGSSYTVQSGSISANLDGPGGLMKSTSGTVTLSGNNTYTGGTLVSAGTLETDKAGGLPAGTDLRIHGGSVVLRPGLDRAIELSGLSITLAEPAPAAKAQVLETTAGISDLSRGAFFAPTGQGSSSPGHRPGKTSTLAADVSSGQRPNGSPRQNGWPVGPRRSIGYRPIDPGQCPGLDEPLGLRPEEQVPHQNRRQETLPATLPSGDVCRRDLAPLSIRGRTAKKTEHRQGGGSRYRHPWAVPRRSNRMNARRR